jgi:TonB family protein
MSMNHYPDRISFGLLPEPEGRSASFITSTVVNMMILSLVLVVGMTAKRVIEQHKYEQTELIFPTTPPPQVKVKVPMPKPPDAPKPVEMKFQPPKITMPRIEPKPVLKPIEMEAKLTAPTIKAAKPSIILAPQPKAALTAAAPAQVPQARPSTQPVHFGQLFGVTPNPNASRPATVAAIGNPYGGMNGAAVASRGVVGSAGIGNGTRSGSNAGVVGKVASAGVPGSTGTAPVMPASTNLEVLSKPPVQYTSEARQLKVQGDVVLRVTFTAHGEVLVQGVVHGLGHGLDDEARRVAQMIRFRPATRNGQAVDLTTNITITFQLA